ncbi:MAG: hypothetical protein V1736_05310 [Pseudomonadota bacterium]
MELAPGNKYVRFLEKAIAKDLSVFAAIRYPPASAAKLPDLLSPEILYRYNCTPVSGRSFASPNGRVCKRRSIVKPVARAGTMGPLRHELEALLP